VDLHSIPYMLALENRNNCSILGETRHCTKTRNNGENTTMNTLATVFKSSLRAVTSVSRPATGMQCVVIVASTGDVC
jgi:hypothetical protein